MQRSSVSIIVAGVLMFAPLAMAGERATDDRALAECKDRNTTFVGIEGCLPQMHVAFRTIDAFTEIYPAEAMPLKDRCIELNAGSTTGAATCITSAISSAMRLSEALPDGETLDDPVFVAVSDPALHEKLSQRINAAREAFPNQSIWGGGVYHPYE